MKKYLIFFSLLLIFINCKRKTQSNNNNTNVVVIDTIKKKLSEIFIGKKFYEGDELLDYDYFNGGYLSQDSLLTFSIYKNEKEYIYSIENQINYEDVREYIILDILVLQKNKINNLRYFSYPLNRNKIISYSIDKKEKIFFLDSNTKKIMLEIENN